MTQELDEHTDIVLKRIQGASTKLNRHKCVYNQTRVKFLGHVLTDKGLEVDKKKIEVIEKIKELKNKKCRISSPCYSTYKSSFPT